MKIALYSKDSFYTDTLKQLIKNVDILNIDYLEEILDIDIVIINITDGIIASLSNYLDNNKDKLFLLLSKPHLELDAYANVKVIYKPACLNDILSAIQHFIKLRNNHIRTIKIGRYDFDFMQKSIFCGNKIIDLTEKESMLIKYLYDKKLEVDKNVLLEELWGYTSQTDTHTIETHIYRLRKKLKSDIIHTGKNGYKLID